MERTVPVQARFPYTHQSLRKALAEREYFLDEESCRKLVIYLALGKPVGLRGEPGVGKSELAEQVAKLLSVPLIDIECHSQLEASDIGVSWNSFRQIVDAQTGRMVGEPFSRDYLNHTPLVMSLTSPSPVVVRVDEVDKLNETTSNFFLRYLDKRELIVHDLAAADNVLRAQAETYVFLTSNDYRELDPAFMRRVVWIELQFPTEEELRRILSARVKVSPEMARRLAYLVIALRELPLKKKPSVGEALDWTRGLLLVADGKLTMEAIHTTIGLLLKFPQDEQKGLELIRSWIA